MRGFRELAEEAVTRAVRKIRRDTPYQGYTRTRLRTVQVGSGLPTVDELSEELSEYWDVLLGRSEAPLQGVTALMETADMYYARASEINALIMRGERDGTIGAGSEYKKFRTGELRDFRDVARKASDLGSRRLTAVSVETEQAKLGRESADGD